MPKLIIKRDWSSKILKNLELLSQGEVVNKDTWRSKAYQKAIYAITSLGIKIYTIDDIRNVKGIGTSILDKIQELMNTGIIQKVELIKQNPVVSLVNQLTQINGVGPTKALKIVDSGITYIDQLKERLDLLTTKQQLGFKNYYQGVSKIPRNEMDLHQSFIKSQSKIDTIIAGSYRRQAGQSGDIDVLVTCPKDDVQQYHQFISSLKKIGYLTDDIAYGDTKYNGYCRLTKDSMTRRIDILFCKREDYPFALLYFTGSGDFNQEMRGILSKRGLRLNEKCLMKLVESKWVKIDYKFTNEKDIFEYLKIPFIEPKDRSAHMLKKVLGQPSKKIKLVIKPKLISSNKMEVGETKFLDGYLLQRTSAGYMCDCSGWKYQRLPPNKRTCKHLRNLLGDEHEKRRINEYLNPIKKIESKYSFQFILANKWNPDSHNPTGWLMSEKLDGVRSCWTGSEFISRLGNTFPAPKWFKEQMPKGIRLDGELFTKRKNFQETVSIVKNSGLGCEWKKIKFHVFDSPDTKKGFEDRIEYAKVILNNNPIACVLPQITCKGVDHVFETLKKIEELGGEGVMLRKSNSIYEGKRSSNLLKVKSFYDAEAIVIKHNPGSGRHKGRLGSLQCRMESGKTFRVGTGFTDSNRDSPPAIGSIVTYRFQEYTKAGIPRFPSFQGIRIDGEGAKDYKF
jgi:DNA ligase 1